jgi:hypothetical protein
VRKGHVALLLFAVMDRHQQTDKSFLKSTVIRMLITLYRILHPLAFSSQEYVEHGLFCGNFLGFIFAFSKSSNGQLTSVQILCFGVVGFAYSSVTLGK